MRTFKLLIVGLFFSQFSFAQIKNPNILLEVPKNIQVNPNVFAQKKISKAVWTTLLNTTLKNSFLNINNYDASGKDASGNFQFYKIDDMKLRLGRSPFGIENTYTIEPIWLEPLTVYFKNINSNSAMVDSKNKKIQFVVHFENDDAEIIVDCVRNLSCSSLGKPQLQVNGLVINIEIEPYAENGKVKYKNLFATISAKSGRDGFNFILPQLEPLSRAMNGELFALLSFKMISYLNQEPVIDEISEKIMAGISRNKSLLGISKDSVYFNEFFVDAEGNIIYSLR